MTSQLTDPLTAYSYIFMGKQRNTCKDMHLIKYYVRLGSNTETECFDRMLSVLRAVGEWLQLSLYVL